MTSATIDASASADLALPIAFIGGGNMARAILGGLRAADPQRRMVVVEPSAEARATLRREFAGVDVIDAPGDALRAARTVVWAVKPQSFAEAARAARAWIGGALQLSVMAGIPTDALARAAGTQAVVRAMPNTPALIGQGIAGLFARSAVTAAQRAEVERVLAPTGRWLWLDDERKLDAVTALSGSGPAYVFYVLEAMIDAGTKLGLSADEGKQLALATLAGATALAAQSNESPATLRERVTSKGGTTHAALAVLRERHVHDAFGAAMAAAEARARELGDEFSRS